MVLNCLSRKTEYHLSPAPALRYNSLVLNVLPLVSQPFNQLLRLSKNLVGTFCWLGVFLLTSALLAPATFAQTGPSQQVGTHLGEGDITFQVKIMDLLASNGAGPGFPVTVMVSSNNSQDEMNALAAGVKRNQFFAIVRINDVCTGADAARVVAQAKTAFGPDTPIEWGNEVNNKTVECPDYSAYAREYNLVRNLPNVGPSALDFYNTQDLASTFQNQVSLNGDDVYFANAYGCIGNEVENCNLETTNTQEIGLAYAKSQAAGNFYLTEFSLSPGGDTKAPDTNLLNVVKFIGSRASETGAKAITPLIRNVCTDDGDWLLYLDGQVLTRNGAFIDPATCSPTDSTKAPYYIYPINSLQDALTQSLSPQAAGATISEELIKQGYEVSCTAPEGLFRASMENYQDYEQYVGPLTQLGNQTISFSENVDYSDVSYPLFRASQPADSVNDSIEAHFGYLETDPNLDEIGKETQSASVYRLLTLNQQCNYQKKILSTINAMCSKLQDPASCALYQPIPNSSYTTQTLYQALQNNDISCEPKERADDTPEEQKMYEALQNTPLYLDKAYRMGFVVFTAQQRGSIDLNNNGWDFLFNRSQNPSGQPEHEVRVVAFRLPDIGTNKDQESDIYYEDPLRITRNALTPPGAQQQKAQEYNDKRQDFLADAQVASNLSFPTTEALINCSGPACQDPLSRALVNLINSGTDNFDETCRLNEKERQRLINEFEASSEIETKGTIETEGISNTPDSPENGLGTFFKNSFQFLTNIFQQPDTSKADPQAFKISGDTIINPDRYANGAFISAAKFNTFLIYPVGYEYDQVVDALAGSIKTVEELNTFKDPEKVEPYFMLSDINQGFESEVKKTEYGVPQGLGDCAQPQPVLDPITGALIPAVPGSCAKTIEYKTIGYLNDNDGDDSTDSIDFEPRIKGGLLGQVMRDIQLSLRRVGSQAWYYIESCQTTEEFLLGQCDEDAANKPRGDDELAGQCKALYGSAGTNATMTVYDREQTFRKVVAAARKVAPASEAKRFAQTLWGVLEIEGSPYLRVMRTVADGSTDEIACAETINSCGAVGPLQIIQGACVTNACPYSDLNYLRSFERPDNLCDIEEALDWTAENLWNQYDTSITDDDERHAAMAGSHAGLGRCDEAFSAQPIGGCNALSYCDCASFGFSNRFEDMWTLYGGDAPNVDVVIN